MSACMRPDQSDGSQCVPHRRGREHGSDCRRLRLLLPQPAYPGYNLIGGSASEAMDPQFRPNDVDSFDLTIQRQIGQKVAAGSGLHRPVDSPRIPAGEPERGAVHDVGRAGSSSRLPMRNLENT
jgi:hypothetical protein